MAKKNKRALLWGGFILAIIVSLWGLSRLNSKNTNQAGQTNVGNILFESVSLDENIKGNKDAKLTLVEYSDFECPACAGIYPIVDQLSEEFKDNLRIVYRHYPLKEIHTKAQLTAQATEAAALQGKFWNMHDVIFNTQKQWSVMDEEQAGEFLIKLAESVGLDIEKFKVDLDGQETRDKVDANYESGTKSGIQGTPTFFLNNKLIETPGTYAGFKQLIESQISGS